jgi:hypothetical protein
MGHAHRIAFSDSRRWDPLRKLPLAGGAYFRANALRTDVVAAVTADSDLTNGAWTKTRTTNSTATVIVTDAGVATTYLVSQTPTGLAANHSCRIYFESKAGTLTHLACVVGGATAIVHANDGTQHSNTATTTLTSLGDVGGGKYGWTFDVPAALMSAVVVTFYACDAAGATSWTSLGGDTITCTGVVSSQTQVSALGSIAGQVVSLAQATAANRPQVQWTNAALNIYTPVNMDGVAGWYPVLASDKVNDLIKGAYTLVQPYTLMTRFRFATDPTGGNKYVSDGNTVDTAALLFNNTQGKLGFYSGTANVFSTLGAADLVNNHTVALTVAGGVATFYVDGAYNATGTSGNSNPGGLTLFSAANPAVYSDLRMPEYLHCSSALSPAQIAAYHRWAAAVYP